MWEEVGIYLLGGGILEFGKADLARPQEDAGWSRGRLGLLWSPFSIQCSLPPAAQALGTDSPHPAQPGPPWGDGQGAKHWGGFG